MRFEFYNFSKYFYKTTIFTKRLYLYLPVNFKNCKGSNQSSK